MVKQKLLVIDELGFFPLRSASPALVGCSS